MYKWGVRSRVVLGLSIEWWSLELQVFCLSWSSLFPGFYFLGQNSISNTLHEVDFAVGVFGVATALGVFIRLSSWLWIGFENLAYFTFRCLSVQVLHLLSIHVATLEFFVKLSFVLVASYEIITFLYFSHFLLLLLI